MALLDGLYAAAAEPELWPRALDCASAWLNCRTSQLVVLERQTNSAIMSLTNPGADEANAAFVAHYARINPHIALLNQVGPGKLVAMERHFDEAFVRRSEFYQDFYLRFGYRYLLGGTMHASTERLAIFGFHRTPGDGPWLNADLARAHAVTPHLLRVVQLILRLDDLKDAQAASEQALDAAPYGVVVLDARGRVVILNREARRIVDCGGVFRATCSRLSCTRTADDIALQQAIRGACATGGGQPGGAGGALSIPRPDGRRNFAVLVAPLPRRSPFLGAGHAAAIVFLTDPERNSEPPGDCLVRVLGLTPAEAKVATALADGLSINEICAAHKTTRNTVRTQVQAALEKTGVRRQAELVRLVAKLPRLARP